MRHDAILIDKQVVPTDYQTSLMWAQTHDTTVKLTTGKTCWVSTVFIGRNLGTWDHDLWFETMVFPLESVLEMDCRRYETWDEAEKGT